MQVIPFSMDEHIYHFILNNFDFNGRTLRVDFAETEKQSMQAAAGLNAQASARGPQAGRPPVALPNQSNAPSNPETINNYLEGMSSAQLYDMIAKMKVLVQQNQDQARQLLLGNPHLAYALLQAQYLFGMINVQTVQKLLAKTPPIPAVPAPVQVPPIGMPMMGGTPVIPNPGAYVPPPQSYAPPPPVPFQQGSQILQQYLTQAFGDVQLQEQQKELLQQVVNLTQEQIEALPLAHRQQVQQLRQTLLGGFAQAPMPMQQWR